MEAKAHMQRLHASTPIDSRVAGRALQQPETRKQFARQNIGHQRRRRRPRHHTTSHQLLQVLPVRRPNRCRRKAIQKPSSNLVNPNERSSQSPPTTRTHQPKRPICEKGIIALSPVSGATAPDAVPHGDSAAPGKTDASRRVPSLRIFTLRPQNVRRIGWKPGLHNPRPGLHSNGATRSRRCRMTYFAEPPPCGRRAARRGAPDAMVPDGMTLV